MDKAMPHVLNKLTLSSQLIMNFSRQVAHWAAFVLMESAPSHCFVNSTFADTFGWKGDNTLVLGNGDHISMEGHIEFCIKIQQYHSQSNCLVSKLSDGINMILANGWLVQQNAQWDFQSIWCVFDKDHCEITMYVNLVRSQSPNPHGLIAMQFKCKFRKEQPHSYFIQLLLEMM